MPVHILVNEAPPGMRQTVNEGIIAAVGHRKGDWQASITSHEIANAWDVEVQGPDEFHWARRFSGGDRDPEVITEAVRAAVIMGSQGLSGALAQLAREGLAFTSEQTPDGQTVYIIDRVRLEENEIIHLQMRGALTREGIRHFLVDRDAA